MLSLQPVATKVPIESKSGPRVLRRIILATVAVLLVAIQLVGDWSDPPRYADARSATTAQTSTGTGPGSEPHSLPYPDLPWEPFDPRDPYLVGQTP